MRLAKFAVGGAHVLLVEVPGFWSVRTAIEHAVTVRGWQRALSPADADALVVCGAAGKELSHVIEMTWEQFPGPRVRVDLESVDEIPTVLHKIENVLRAVREEPPASRECSATAQHQVDLGHEDMVGGGMEHDAMHHDGMDHDEMEMAPAGIALAGGGEDRDRLEMDVLRVPLGPVLPHWPAGLVLHCVLHGDVIGAAQPAFLPAAHPSAVADEASSAFRAARSCDSARDMLALAGRQDAASSARRITAALVAGIDATAALDRLHRQVSRSRLLRWSLRGLGTVTSDHLAQYGLAEHLLGDVHDRLISTLTRARSELAGHAAERPDDGSAVEAIPDLVAGLDVAAARLVVASLALRTASPEGSRYA